MASTFTKNTYVGDSTLLEAADRFTRTGCTCVEWNTKADGTGISYQPGTAAIFTANTSLYARWKANKYTVTFDANGGKGGWSKELVYGSEILAPTVSWEGHTFSGWDVSVPDTVPDHDITITARWDSESYLITFDANGGVNGWSEERPYGSTIVPPTVTREGYTFVCWSPGVNVTVNGPATYVAQWERNTMTVTFDGNFPPTYGSDALTFSYDVPSPITKYTEEEIGELGTVGEAYTNPGGEGYHIIPDNANHKSVAYKFMGWYTSPSGGVRVSETTTFSENITLYARWQRRNYIRLNKQYGDGGDVRYVLKRFIDQGMSVGQASETLVLPTLSRSGYAFLGWYSAQDPEDGSGYRKKDSSYPKVEDGHLCYVLKYKMADGTASSNLRKIYVSSVGDEVSWTDVDTGEVGNTVKLWDADLGAEVNVGGVPRASDFAPTSNTILYAHWTANPYTITWNTHGGTSVEPYVRTYGMEIGTLPESTKAGYDLAGWWTLEDSGDEISRDTLVTGNVTYHAHWNATQYTATVSSGDGGTGASTFTYYMSDSEQTKTITLPTKDGYLIDSWTFSDYSGDAPTVVDGVVRIPANTYGNFTMTPTWVEDPIIRNVNAEFESGVPAGSIDYQNKSYIYLYWANQGGGQPQYLQTNNSKVFGNSSYLGQSLTGISGTASAGGYSVKFTNGGRSGITLKSITPSGSKLYTMVKLSPYICVQFVDMVGGACVNSNWKYTDRYSSGDWSMNMNSSQTMPVTGYSYYSRGKYFRVMMTIQDLDGTSQPIYEDASISDNLNGWSTATKSPTILTFDFRDKIKALGLHKGAKTTKIEFFESTSTSYTWPAAVNAVCLYKDSLN